MHRATGPQKPQLHELAASYGQLRAAYSGSGPPHEACISLLSRLKEATRKCGMHGMEQEAGRTWLACLLQPLHVMSFLEKKTTRQDSSKADFEELKRRGERTQKEPIEDNLENREAKSSKGTFFLSSTRPHCCILSARQGPKRPEMPKKEHKKWSSDCRGIHSSHSLWSSRVERMSRAKEQKTTCILFESETDEISRSPLVEIAALQARTSMLLLVLLLLVVYLFIYLFHSFSVLDRLRP